MMPREIIRVAAIAWAVALILLIPQPQSQALAADRAEVVAVLVEMIEMDRETAQQLVVEHRDDGDAEALREATDLRIADDQATLKECLYGRYDLDARMQWVAGEDVVFPEEVVYDKFRRDDPDGGVAVAKAPAPGLPILPAGFSVLMNVGIELVIDSARAKATGDLQSRLSLALSTYRGRDYPVDRERLPDGVVYNHWWTPVLHSVKLPTTLHAPDGKPVLLASLAAGDDPENRSLLIFITTWIVK